MQTAFVQKDFKETTVALVSTVTEWLEAMESMHDCLIARVWAYDGHSISVVPDALSLAGPTVVKLEVVSHLLILGISLF